MRAALLPYKDFAARTGVAIVVITHTNKSTSVDALDRIAGSKAFSQAARAAFMVLKDDVDPDKRMLLPGKNNLGNDRTGFAFRLVEEQVEGAGSTPRLEWLEEVALTASEALSEQAARVNGATRVAEAGDWLRDLLAEGPVEANEVKLRGETAGFSLRSLQRAKAELGVRSEKRAAHWW